MNTKSSIDSLIDFYGYTNNDDKVIIAPVERQVIHFVKRNGYWENSTAGKERRRQSAKRSRADPYNKKINDLIKSSKKLFK